MAHIHTEPGQHDLTASAYIVDVSQLEPRIWLHMHKKLGLWLQFGGHVELGENPWQTLEHEIREESGFSMDQLKVLQPLPRLKLANTTQQLPIPVAPNSHRFGNTDHYHTDFGVAFTTTENPGLAVEDGESTTLRTFTVGEIKDLAESEIYPNVRTTVNFILEEILVAWEQVETTEFNR